MSWVCKRRFSGIQRFEVHWDYRLTVVRIHPNCIGVPEWFKDLVDGSECVGLHLGLHLIANAGPNTLDEAVAIITSPGWFLLCIGAANLGLITIYVKQQEHQLTTLEAALLSLLPIFSMEHWIVERSERFRAGKRHFWQKIKWNEKKKN